MPRTRSRTTMRVRVIDDSGAEDSALLRWAAQLLLGGLPGLMICVIIMWMASKPASQGSAAHIASIVPLLSASGLADSPAFHRMGFDRSASADHAPQFRLPQVEADSHGTDVVVTAKCTLPSDVDSNTPRTAWNYLGASVRAQIDAGLAKGSTGSSVVLHGSGGIRGNARLLDRYQAGVLGLAQGGAYHFVIGNGNGASDGVIETGRRWGQSPTDVDAQGRTINVCLVGDFNSKPPSKAQMAALHELMDYLSIKVGAVEVTVHRNDDGSPGSCLGMKFAGPYGVK